jgi:hypothetical protein
VASKLSTLQANILDAVGSGVEYLTAVQDPFAKWGAGQVRCVGDVRRSLNLGLLVPASVLVVPAGETRQGSGAAGNLDGVTSTRETVIPWDFYLAVTSYTAAGDGLPTLFQLHDDLFDAIEGYPIATGVPEFAFTKLFFLELREWTTTEAAIIWRARYACPYLRQGTRAVVG